LGFYFQIFSRTCKAKTGFCWMHYLHCCRCWGRMINCESGKPEHGAPWYSVWAAAMTAHNHLYRGGGQNPYSPSSSFSDTHLYTVMGFGSYSFSPLCPGKGLKSLFWLNSVKYWHKIIISVFLKQKMVPFSAHFWSVTFGILARSTSCSYTYLL